MTTDPSQEIIESAQRLLEEGKPNEAELMLRESLTGSEVAVEPLWECLITVLSASGETDKAFNAACDGVKALPESQLLRIQLATQSLWSRHPLAEVNARFEAIEGEKLDAYERRLFEWLRKELEHFFPHQNWNADV